MKRPGGPAGRLRRGGRRRDAAPQARCAARACGCGSTTARRGCSTRTRRRRSGCWRWPASWSTSPGGGRRWRLTRRPAVEPTLAERLARARAAPRRRLRRPLRRAPRRLLAGARRPHAWSARRAGTETGAAMRVVAGDVDLLRPRRRSRRGRPRAPRRRGRRGGARAARRAAAAARARAARRASRSIEPPEAVPPARKAELLRECDERARGAGDDGRQVQRRLQRGPARGAGGQLRRAAGGRRPHARAARRAGGRRAATTASRPGAESLAGHAGFELFDGDPAAVADEAARRALTMLDARPAPAGPMTGRGRQRLRRRAVPRGHRPRARVGRGAEARFRVRGAARRAGSPPPIVTAYDDGTHAGRVGDRRDRRRGHAVLRRRA